MNTVNFSSNFALSNPNQVFNSSVGNNAYTFSQDFSNLADAFIGVNFNTQLAAEDLLLKRHEAINSDANAFSEQNEIKDKDGNTVGYSSSASQSFSYSYSSAQLPEDSEQTFTQHSQSDRTIAFNINGNDKTKEQQAEQAVQSLLNEKYGVKAFEETDAKGSGFAENSPEQMLGNQLLVNQRANPPFNHLDVNPATNSSTQVNPDFQPALNNLYNPLPTNISNSATKPNIMAGFYGEDDSNPFASDKQYNVLSQQPKQPRPLLAG